MKKKKDSKNWRNLRTNDLMTTMSFESRPKS